MTLDVFGKNDVRNILVQARSQQAAAFQASQKPGVSIDPLAFGEGYETALAVLAAAFGLDNLVVNNRLHQIGIGVPASRLSVSYRAQLSLTRLLATRDQMRQGGTT